MNRLSRVLERSSYSNNSKESNQSTRGAVTNGQYTRNGELILYKDRFACLTPTKLKLYDYYMSGLSRTIDVDKIIAVVSTDNLGLRWEDRNSGGLALSAHILWTNDWRRGTWGIRQNDDVLIVVKGEKWRKGFSLENREMFISLLQSLIDDIQCSKTEKEPSNSPERQRKYLS
jgi:hypothetical protein